MVVGRFLIAGKVMGGGWLVRLGRASPRPPVLGRIGEAATVFSGAPLAASPYGTHVYTQVLVGQNWVCFTT
jgi:hypothetical protein